MNADGSNLTRLTNNESPDYGPDWQSTTAPPDGDGDGIADGADNCPTTANLGQADAEATAVATSATHTPSAASRVPSMRPRPSNTGKAGKTYPVKFQVLDESGASRTSTDAVTSVRHKSVGCDAFSGDPTDAIESTATGSGGLRVEGDRFVFNWNSPAAPGCYELFVTLADGGVHTANFRLK